MIKYKLLVVEDNKNLGLLYEQELEDEGYEVVIAYSFIEALEMIKKNLFDLVITSVVNRVMNNAAFRSGSSH